MIQILWLIIQTLFITNTYSSCNIKYTDKLSFNGALEPNHTLQLDEFENNQNFTFNFLLKFDSSRFTPELTRKYQIVNLDDVLKVYLQYYAGKATINFHLLADYDSSSDITRYDVVDGVKMHVTIMRNKGVNWGYHVFYQHNMTDFREN